MQLIYTLLAFAAGFLVVFGVNWLLADLFEARRQRARERLEAELRERQRQRARGTAQAKELYELAAEGYGSLASRPDLRRRLTAWLEQSGVRMRWGQLAAMVLTASVGPGLVAGMLSTQWALGLIAAAVGGMLPLAFVGVARRRRQEKFRSQLPDAFDLMSRVLRAGQTISQSMLSVAEEFSRPLGDEFMYCHEQQNLGLSPEAALRDLAQRSGLLELKIFVLAVMVQRQTGGNLSELLGKLSDVIRDRERIRGHIKSLTAEGRMQGLVLLGLPPLMLVIMLGLNRPYAMTLFEYPSLLVGLFVSETLGALWMRKIVNFDH